MPSKSYAFQVIPIRGCLYRFKTRTRGLSWCFVGSASCSVVLVDRSAEHSSALDPAFYPDNNSLVVIGWALLSRLVRSMPVVVLDVLLQDRSKVPFVVDQHPVYAFGSDRAHPAFGIAVGQRRRLLPIQTISIDVSG